ncbi:MAG: chorismate mutase [Dehalococcoidia bacterium]|nr:chorismate mutase [Dehalococcoidia bacterium]
MTLACRGIRGATTAEANTRDAIAKATQELLEELIKANDIRPENVAAAIFSTTRDLTAAYPATTARVHFGWTHVAFMSTHEQEVPDDLKHCIRVLVLVNTEKKQEEVRFVYLKEAVALRNRGVTTS